VFTKTSIVAQENTSISSPDFKKKDKTETKSLNMIGARFIVSMQQEPGFAARPYLKKRSFRWRALLHVGRHISFDDMALQSSVLSVRAKRRGTNG
jgi:hypothetical protein